MSRKRGKVSATRRIKEHTSGLQLTSFKIPEGMDLFKIKSEGTKRIEIIPFKAGAGNPFADKGQLHYERTYFVHKNVGPDGNSYVCAAKTANKKCPICEHRTMLTKQTDSDEQLIKDLAPKERQLFLVVDHADIEKGAQLWDVSFFLFGKQLDKEIENADEDDTFEFFADQEDGSTLKIGIAEKSFGGYKFYDVDSINFKERRIELDSDLYDEAACLDDLLIFTDYDELKNAFLQIETDEDEDAPKKKKPVDDEDDPFDEDDEPEEKPKAKASKKKKKKVVKKTEPEDEEEDEFKLGRRCKVEIDDEDYEGMISSKPKNGRIEVTFDDGDITEFDKEDVEIIPEKKKTTKKTTSKKAKKEEKEDESFGDDDDSWDDD